MSVLVNNQATFKISFYFREIKNKENETIGIGFPRVEYRDDDFNITDFEVHEGEDKEDYKNFTGIFIPGNFEQMSLIREEASVINHINEKSVLLLRIFCPKIIHHLCKEWNLVNDNGEPLRIHEECAKQMHEHFLSRIIEEWRTRVGDGDY